MEKEWIQEIRWIFGGKTERWSKDGYLENIRIFGEFINIAVGMIFGVRMDIGEKWIWENRQIMEKIWISKN